MIEAKYKKFSENVTWNTANRITRKSGILAHLCVKIRSALSDFVSSPFFTGLLRLSVGEKCSHMYLYLASAISASASFPNSQALLTFFAKKSFAACASLGWVSTSKLSPSTSFTAWNKGESTSASLNAISAFSIAPYKRQFFKTLVALRGAFAASIARLMRSGMFVSRSAEISTTGRPIRFSSSCSSISSPLFSSTSVIFSATTIGISTSKSCVVKYKFLSKFVASTILIIQSGRSSRR